MEDAREVKNARRYFAKNNLEGERPTKFFCSLSKKLKSKAQFKTLHVKEVGDNGEEVIREVTKQNEVEWDRLASMTKKTLTRKLVWKRLVTPLKILEIT